MATLLLISTVLKIALRLYTYVLWARLIIDWITVFNPAFKPRGIALILIDLVFRLTDPPLKFFRKVIPPLKLGNIQLELGWMITMFACILLMAFLP